MRTAHVFLVSVWAAAFCSQALAQNHAPVVSNVTSSQRTDGSKLVDIRYNLADADGDACTVTVQASSDGGATWIVPITAVSGAFGAGITPGVNKLIVWNSATNLPAAFGSQYKVRVCADDGEANSGSIVTWGHNYYGQAYVPAPNSGFVTIAAGYGYNMGVKADGSIVAWGDNQSGQCNVPAPNSGFVAVAGGVAHSMGLKADGSIAAWGNNNYGQCNVPAPNSGFVAVAGDGYHSLGLKVDGSIVAWGWNNYGQCNVPTPNSGFVAVAGGYQHSLGLKADGSIVAWGRNSEGQCNVPAPNSGFVAVAAGYFHSLGLKADGSIVAWGNNGNGQCNVPAPNSGFVAAAGGGHHSLGLKADGSIVAWGYNYYSQCNVPAPNSGFVAVAAGYNHSLGLKGGFCGDSPAFTIDNRGSGALTVWASVSYDEQTKLLSIAARAFDAVTGSYITTGTAAYDLAPLPYSGNLTYTGALWAAQVDLSANPPTVGQHPVAVTIRQATAATWFNVGSPMGVISGHVRDVAGDPVVGADVSLYDSVNFHGSGPLQAFDSTTTDPNGAYGFSDVVAGSYVVFAEAAGHLSLDRPATLDNGETVVIDLVLPSEPSLAWLMTAMQSLHDRTVQAMNAETLLMPEITEQAADDLNYGGDDLAWDVAGAIGGILSGASRMGINALRWIAEEASWDTIDTVITTLVAKAAIKTCVMSEIERQIVTRGATYLLPEDGNPWRRYEYEELVQISDGPYGEGAGVLQASNNEFQQTAPLMEADPAFDFAAAWRAIASQEQLIRRIADGQMTAFLPFPDPEDGLTGVSLPIGRQAWLMNHVVLSLLGGTSHALTTIQIGAGGFAVGAAVTGIGLPAAGVAGSIAVAAGTANTIVGVADLLMRWEATVTYGMVAKGWSQDMLALPTPYQKTRSFLEAQAAQPTYLATGRSYSAAVSVDLHADLWNWVYVHGLPFGWKTADVHITNTGNTTSTFRVVATGWWDYHLPGDWPWIGGLFGGVTLVKVPVSLMALAGPSAIAIGPGQTATAHVPYMGVYIDPFNMFSPHWLQVDVYSGPFLVATRSEPFYVVWVPLKNKEAGRGDGYAGFNSTFLRGRSSEFMDVRNVDDFLPVITTLADTVLSPDDAVLEVPFTVNAGAWSAALQLVAQQTASVSLRVYDAAGRCVGYDVSRGGAQREFPATYSGAGEAMQVVEIPAAAGNTYTIKAVLDGANSSEPVGIQLWALETPARPAVMSVVPAEFSRTAYAGEGFSVPVLVGESGGQVPLEGVTITIGTITGPDETALVLTSWDGYSFESIPAGRSNRVEFGLAVPQNAPSGTYAGTVTVASTNAGTQVVDVQIEVHRLGDLEPDGNIDLCDFARFQQCFTGPGPATLDSGCTWFDFDHDDDVDADDVASFSQVLTGP